MSLKTLWSLIVVVSFSLYGVDTIAQEGSSKQSAKAKGTATKPAKKAKKTKRPKAGKAKQTVEREKEEVDPLDDTSTSFDFEETLLEGKFKAPSGMVLKGRVQQSKSQMVQLRKNFRPDLRKSSAAVRAIRPRD